MKSSLEDQIKKPVAQEYATKLTLIGFFITIFITFISSAQKKKSWKPVEIKPLDIAILGLSTYRLGRLIAYDRVADPLRKPFTRTVPDQTGAGMSVEPRGKGIRQAIGQLLSCPICSGTWIAAGLVYALQALPNPTRVFLAIMSSTGIAELLNSLTEALSWTGQAARWRAGSKTSRRFRQNFIKNEEEKINGRNYQKHHRQK
jgi:hypothetical protein